MLYRFGDQELDFSLYELRRAGERVRIDRKVFDLLRYLVEHRDRVVTKQELLREVWNGEAVVEAVVPTAVARLRRALGQQGSRGGPIETAHGRGYRFVAELTAAPAAAPRELDTDLQPALVEAFVGREPVVRRLSGALDRARGGQAQLRWLTGEPGVGRTRTAHELTRRARNAGVLCTTARCHEGDAADALWLWTLVLRQVLDSLPGDVARSLPRNQRACLSALLPELTPGGEAPAPREGSRELFDAVARLLSQAAHRAPRVIVLDDLHWADSASLSLLDYLARELDSARVLIVATMRDTELPPEHGAVTRLQQLKRLEQVKQVALEPLTAQDVGRYVQELCGLEPPIEVCEALHACTGGIPLLLHDAGRDLATRMRNGETPTPEMPRLPARAHELVQARVDALGETVRTLLGAAAVAGMRIELPTLRRVLEMPTEQMLSALDRARRSRLLVEDESGELRFHSALLREVIYQDLPTAQRCQLHLTIGEALEQEKHLRAQGTLEIADHLHQALPHGDGDKVLEYGMRAARRAAEGADHGEEARWYARAHEALRYAERADPERSAELMVALGRAHRESGRPTAARKALERALELTRLGQASDHWASAARAELERLD